ncbi:hypothetical protein H8D57_02655 [bacterium]|nr:hypothetical protein [bacterium]
MSNLNYDQIKGLYQEISKPGNNKYYLHRGEALLVEKVIKMAKIQFADDPLIQTIEIEQRGKTDELIRDDAVTAIRIIVVVLQSSTQDVKKTEI